MALNLEQADLCFGHILDYGAANLPDKTAIICHENAITYSELDQNAGRAANIIAGLAKPGERVGICSVNCIEYFEIVIGCARAGAVAVNINWRLSPREIINLLEFNNCRSVFMRIENDPWEQEVRRLAEGKIRIISLEPQAGQPSEYKRMRAMQPGRFCQVPTDPDQVLMHIHTSGTTGIPKCVMHTHRGFISEMLCCIDIMNITKDEVFQVMSQMFHVASIGPYMELYAGGTLVLFSRFDADLYLRSIEENRVTRLSVIPTILKRLLAQMKVKHYNLESLKTVSYSSCPIPPSVMDEAADMLHCGFVQSYGMTEMGSVVTFLSPGDHSHPVRVRSVGRCIPGTQVRIVDREGRACRNGEVGEITAKGPSMLKGYYRYPEGVNKNVRDGWFHTGDLGYLDDDGYLYLEGRKNDMIISGGENIYPKEIEDRCMELTEDISEAAVFGIDDEDWGEVPYACIVLQQGSRLTAEEVRSYLRDHLAHFKVPKIIEIVESLPKNAVGKVMKGELRTLKSRKPCVKEK